MDNPTKIRWWQSKTIWASVGTILTGAYLAATGNIPEGVASIITGATAIFGRATATQEITTPKPPTEATN